MLHNMNFENLPTSWDNFRFEDYMKCIDINLSEGNLSEVDELFSGLDNTIRVISALTNVPLSELENADLSLITSLAKRLSFMVELPKEKSTSTLNWKNVDEVNYNDFVTFISLSKDPIHQLPLIIKTFSKEPLTEEQINNLSVSEVYSGFFSLRKLALKSMRSSQKQVAIQLTKFQVKSLVTHFKERFRRKRRN